MEKIKCVKIDNSETGDLNDLFPLHVEGMGQTFFSILSQLDWNPKISVVELSYEEWEKAKSLGEQDE